MFTATQSIGIQNSYSFVALTLKDEKIQEVLKQEGISPISIDNLKKSLDLIKCHSFFSLSTSNIETGTPYIHIEFKYDDWNGADFYFYKLFDKKIERNMVNFFNRSDIKMGNLTGTGGILDSNAVWYFLTDCA